MNGRKLQDRLYLGLGSTARHVGESADAYRPSGSRQPLAKKNRFLRLPAAFVSARGNDTRANTYGDALWNGIFDASYTRPGDFIVMSAGTFFVASQDPLLPVLCVRTNRVISMARPDLQTAAAGNLYGGYIAGRSTVLMEGWPASVLGENHSGSSGANLPTDQSVPCWNILLPMIPELVFLLGDIVTDDLGRGAVITGSELTNLGWRLSARMATT